MLSIPLAEILPIILSSVRADNSVYPLSSRLENELIVHTEGLSFYPASEKINAHLLYCKSVTSEYLVWTLLWSLLKVATFQVLELRKSERKKCSGTCPEDRLCFSHSSVFMWKASMYTLVQILCGKTLFFLPFYFKKKKNHCN